MGTLVVRLVRCSGLAALDAGGTSDPYCEIYVFHAHDEPGDCDMWRTATRMATLDPEFEEERMVLLTRPEVSLHIVLYDCDRVGSDDYLGEVFLSDLRPYAEWESRP